MIVSNLKNWLIGAGAFLVAAGMAWIKYLSGRVDREKRRADVAEAGLERKARTEERENEIDSEWSDKERTANENIDDIPAWLRKRKLRDRD